MTELVCNLRNTLAVDHRLALNSLSSITPLQGDADDPKQHDAFMTSVKEVQYLLEAQKTAIELLTNICSSDGK